MKIAIAGGTGVVGRHTVEAVRNGGHEAVVLSRSQGVDLISGKGLAAALTGVDAVIDTANVSTMKADDAIEFFTTATANLISAAADAGVGHIVLLSIVGIDRMPYDYYVGKVAQEKVLEKSAVPWTIQRATQFHEFAGQIFERAKIGPLHIAPRARTQPIAAHDVGEHLAALATGDPQGRAQDIAGPREEALDAMIKAFARKSGHRGWIPSVNLPTAQMKGMRAGFALPGAGALLAGPPFEEWLAAR
ncbi:SDR family oxidoreductase [Microbacterium murale]|uniref:Nucleoside-diphosphate sugar epimerase n=1 Tax=Microbacterium murale TaxID=1081040 RepID=A0ABQ1S269_9MICO|nr:NAD(P)H-binding protein [Microbacterium murale]GGD87834.1 nucleoside-diphosphate sugar epimerase [Microbacterium murale]